MAALVACQNTASKSGDATDTPADTENTEAPAPSEEKIMTLRGRSVITGLPESVDVSSIEIREALAGSVSLIVDLVKAALDETPPEVVADLMEQGIALAGGGALLQGLAQRLSEEVKVRVWVAPDPLTAVAVGAGQLLENLDTLRSILMSIDRSRRRVSSAAV